MKYKTAYFCGYAKLPSTLPTTIGNASLTVGLKIELATGKIVGVSVTLLSELAKSMVTEYFQGKNVIDDYDSIVEEITYRHQGNAAKSIIKAYSDIYRNFTKYMEENGDYLREEQSNS